MHTTQTEHGVTYACMQAGRAQLMWLQGVVCLHFVHNSLFILYFFKQKQICVGYFKAKFIIRLITCIIIKNVFESTSLCAPLGRFWHFGNFIYQLFTWCYIMNVWRYIRGSISLLSSCILLTTLISSVATRMPLPVMWSLQLPKHHNKVMSITKRSVRVNMLKGLKREASTRITTLGHVSSDLEPFPPQRGFYFDRKINFLCSLWRTWWSLDVLHCVAT